jgi:hypothetical protein
MHSLLICEGQGCDLMAKGWYFLKNMQGKQRLFEHVTLTQNNKGMVYQ